jgi:hypothetical protein
LYDCGVLGLAGGVVHFSGAPPEMVGDGFVDWAATVADAAPEATAEDEAPEAAADAEGVEPALPVVLLFGPPLVPITTNTITRMITTASTLETMAARCRALARADARRSSWRAYRCRASSRSRSLLATPYLLVIGSMRIGSGASDHGTSAAKV